MTTCNYFYYNCLRPLDQEKSGRSGFGRLPSSGRTFVVIPMGGREPVPPGAIASTPDYDKFDRALTTSVRPVLVSLQRLPFRDFTAEEFLGRTIFSCRGGPCVSAFKGSNLRLGQMADAAPSSSLKAMPKALPYRSPLADRSRTIGPNPATNSTLIPSNAFTFLDPPIPSTPS